MSRSTIIRDELGEQLDRSFKMLSAVINNIPSGRWKVEAGQAFIPAAIAYHAVESLDFYFCGESPFDWGYRFRGPWWVTAASELPTKDEMKTYLGEVRERAVAYLEQYDDEGLRARLDLVDWSGRTILGHVVYAIRHTMHHQGQLAALQFQFGIEEDTWV